MYSLNLVSLNFLYLQNRKIANFLLIFHHPLIGFLLDLLNLAYLLNLFLVAMCLIANLEISKSLHDLFYSCLRSNLNQKKYYFVLILSRNLCQFKEAFCFTACLQECTNFCRSSFPAFLIAWRGLHLSPSSPFLSFYQPTYFISF